MIRNEFQREFAYPISLVFFLLLPLLFTAAVGTALGGVNTEKEPEELKTRIYVVTEDEGPLLNALLDALSEVNLEPERVESIPEESFGLEVPADFSESLLAGESVTLTLHTLPVASVSQAVEQYVSAARGRVGGAALVARNGLDLAREQGIVSTPEEEEAFFRDILEETLEDAQNPQAVAEVRWPEGTEIEETAQEFTTSTEQASAGQLVTWVQITLLGAAEVLVDERMGGTLRRMLVVPTSRASILGGKLVARLTLGLVQMAILLVGGAFLFNVDWAQEPLGVALVSIAFGLATVGLGMLVATFVKTRSQASSVVVGLSMGLAALGGAWYPLEITPELYRQVVQILPSTWAMKAYSDLLARGASVADILPHVGILLGFAVVFTVVGMLRFRRYE
ncbi:MAG: ABC transporter permease [Anaerolineae bacterium]